VSTETLLEQVHKSCLQEIRVVRSKSKLKDASVESLISLDDVALCTEIDKFCPVLGAALRGGMGIQDSTKRDVKAMRLQCYSIVFKARYGQNRATVVAHRNDQLLLAAGAKKASFSWFNKMGLTNSYGTLAVR